MALVQISRLKPFVKKKIKWYHCQWFTFNAAVPIAVSRNRWKPETVASVAISNPPLSAIFLPCNDNFDQKLKVEKCPLIRWVNGMEHQHFNTANRAAVRLMYHGSVLKSVTPVPLALLAAAPSFVLMAMLMFPRVAFPCVMPQCRTLLVGLIIRIIEI